MSPRTCKTSWFSQHVLVLMQDVLVLSTRLDTHERRLDSHARRLGSLISTRLSQDCQKTHERVWLARVHVTSRNCTCALTKINSHMVFTCNGRSFKWSQFSCGYLVNVHVQFLLVTCTLASHTLSWVFWQSSCERRVEMREPRRFAWESTSCMSIMTRCFEVVVVLYFW